MQDEIEVVGRRSQFSCRKKKASMTELNRICFVFRALQSRVTPKTSPCLAILLGLNDELMKVPETIPNETALENVPSIT